MRFKIILNFFLLIILNVSCADNPSEGGSSFNKEKASSIINCYRYINNSDTIILKIVHIGESITGTLAYKMPGKNTGKGTIQGEMNNNLLVVRYSPLFDSSVIQQKVFKLTGKYFQEGYGETYNESGQVLFKDISSLKFNDTIKLDEIVCE
jgi:hypothetical protein